VDRIEKLLMRSKRMTWGVVAVTLLVLAGAIALTTFQVRSWIGTQMMGRDAAVLYAVLMMQLEGEGQIEWTEGVNDPVRQLTAVLVTSRLKGVIGARLYDADGGFVLPFPPTLREAELEPEDLAEARELRPRARLVEVERLDEVFYGSVEDPVTPGPLPLLVVNVPLHGAADRELRGVAQFLIEGHTLVGELARLDRHLIYQAATAFFAGGAMLVLSLGWAFRRLRRAQRRLGARTADLQRANEELSRTARTAALGAVTAHLIHGLKSPLTGLQNFVTALGGVDAEAGAAEWRMALASTRRMQSLISEVVNVLREEESGVTYELSLKETAELVWRRVQPLARERGVRFEKVVHGEGRLTNRSGNLALLILVNLIENAIQVTPSGGVVRLDVRPGDDGVVCEVWDEGPGVPEKMRGAVFAPRPSTREGGSGIGLAISKQLANHLGAELELRTSTREGSVFALVLPAACLHEKRDFQQTVP
jgi:signal transduction histidine kinase